MKKTNQFSKGFDITSAAELMIKDQSVLNKLYNKKRRIIVKTLLTDNAKLEKSDDINKGIALLPADSINVYLKPEFYIKSFCATAELYGCYSSCIGDKSGMFSMLNGAAHLASLKRTIFYIAHKAEFLDFAAYEISRLAGEAFAIGGKAYIRCNVFSDLVNLPLEIKKQIPAHLLPFLVWYDYTKISLKNERIINGATRAFSMSKKAYNQKEATIKTLINGRFKFAAVVINETEKTELLKETITLGKNIVFVDGDAFDNFPIYADKHKNADLIVLCLKTKGTKTATKQIAADKMELTKNEAIRFFNSYALTIV